jgi:hypothetical protein
VATSRSQNGSSRSQPEERNRRERCHTSGRGKFRRVRLGRDHLVSACLTVSVCAASGCGYVTQPVQESSRDQLMGFVKCLQSNDASARIYRPTSRVWSFLTSPPYHPVAVILIADTKRYPKRFDFDPPNARADVYKSIAKATRLADVLRADLRRPPVGNWTDVHRARYIVLTTGPAETAAGVLNTYYNCLNQS